MPKRPVGVIVVAVVLGLFAGLLLLMAFGTVAMGALSPQMAQSTVQPGVPAFMKTMMVGLGLVYAAIAAWAIATLVGLVRLKNWGRLSALVMGGLLAFFGLVSLPILLVIPRLMAATPNGATLPAGAIQGVMVFMGLVYGGMLALGVWWLVYFNLRSVKACFLPGYTELAGMPPAGYDAGRPNPYLQNRAAQAQSLATPGGSYLEPVAPSSFPVAGQPHAPTAVMVVGCIFLLGCLCCGAMAFVPLPAFVLGALITGIGVPILYGCLSVLSGYIGLGLLKLWNGARLATYAFLAFGAVNLLMMLTPWYRTQFLAYQGLVNVRMGLPAGPSAIQEELYKGPFFLVIVLISLVMYGAVFWILQRYRAAFVKPADSPASPVGGD